MTATVLSASALTVSRGTFSTAVCVTSAAGPFAEDVSFALVSNGVVSMNPETIKAGLGDASACGVLGAASTA